jgi:hypothetical protein
VCYKAHKEKCLQIEKEIVPLSTSAQSTQVTNEQSNINSIVNSESLLLIEGKKNLLENSSELKAMLQSKKLQEDILSIDALKDDSARQDALRKKRKENPEFENFLNKLLRVLE